MTTTTMLRWGGWRAMNILYRKFEMTGQWPLAIVLGRGYMDVDPDTLIWLYDMGWATVENIRTNEPVGMTRVVKTPQGGYRAGDRHSPTDCAVGLTPAGVHWVENNPHQKALAGVHRSAGRVTLHRLIARGDADQNSIWPLADEGLIAVVNEFDVTLRLPTPTSLGREDLRTCTARTTAEGRRVLAVTS